MLHAMSPAASGTLTRGSGMIREISREEKLGMAIPSAGKKYHHHHWSQNGLRKRKYNGEQYVERRGSESNDC
jgi:hypothetical protein